jgi:hypothetical protein
MKNNMKATIIIQGFLLSVVLNSGNVVAADVMEAEANNTIDTAQNIDSHFSLGANPDILDADIWPWVSISADGDGTNDYYSFNVPAAGVSGVFDIDYGNNAGGSVDTELCLYAANGTVLDGNDDASYVTFGAGGSVHYSDAYLRHVFDAPGTYIIGVGKYNAYCNNLGITGNSLHDGATYVLQVSLSEHGMDSDGDGIADEEDCNSYSDLNPTVMFDGCDTGVANTLVEGGCTIADLAHACSQDATNHGSFSRCVSSVTNDLKRNGDISESDKIMIQSCAAQSNIGK